MPAERAGVRRCLPRAAVRCFLALPLAALLPAVAAAQRPARTARWQAEVRADAFGGDPWAAHGGAGVALRVGTYARLVAIAGAGTSGGWDSGDATRASGRVELLGRFVLDPFRERVVGPYAGAGIAQRLEADASPRTRLTAVVGVELAARGGWLPAIEAGFGGGLRAGVALRRALPDGR